VRSRSATATTAPERNRDASGWYPGRLRNGFMLIPGRYGWLQSIRADVETGASTKRATPVEISIHQSLCSNPRAGTGLCLWHVVRVCRRRDGSNDSPFAPPSVQSVVDRQGRGSSNMVVCAFCSRDGCAVQRTARYLNNRFQTGRTPDADDAASSMEQSCTNALNRFPSRRKSSLARGEFPREGDLIAGSGPPGGEGVVLPIYWE
jgi:hypothetical protein